jgi:excisionase family DNA binding protein
MAKLTDYVKVAEAAAIPGVSQGTLRAWAADGKVPVYHNPANGYRLFKRSDLDHFLKQIAASGEKKQTTSSKCRQD